MDCPHCATELEFAGTAESERPDGSFGLVDVYWCEGCHSTVNDYELKPFKFVGPKVLIKTDEKPTVPGIASWRRVFFVNFASDSYAESTGDDQSFLSHSPVQDEP